MKNGLWAARLSTAETRNCLASDLSRKPRAPASRTSRTRLSVSCMVKIRTSTPGTRLRICRVASTPFTSGSAVVEDDDVRPGGQGLVDGLLAVPGLADHLPAFVPLQDGPDAGADHVVIVGDQDARHRETSFRDPVPAADPVSPSAKAGYTCPAACPTCAKP